MEEKEKTCSNIAPSIKPSCNNSNVNYTQPLKIIGISNLDISLRKVVVHYSYQGFPYQSLGELFLEQDKIDFICEPIGRKVSVVNLSLNP